MSWADDASKDALDAAKVRNLKLAEFNEIMDEVYNSRRVDRLPSPNALMESLRSVDEECPCQEDHGLTSLGQKVKCGNTNLVEGTGFCLPCIHGCLP